MQQVARTDGGILDDVTKPYESWASSPASRAVMQANRRRDTSPEMAVRRLVHAAGLRYRVDTRPLSDLNRRADLVFRGAKVAVFIDGCYWHGCPKHGTVAKSNADYWSPKIARNRERDAETDRLLVDAGWTVIRAWEHEVPSAVAQRILSAVPERRA
ncbi:very short patch repair endonuclease [Nocardioides jejuensis]|uniref:Very short patch repair endonuclease n=1 Tax=Nocardioides jejuensis TaxID=2502782 RepID=A0A4R1BVC5_9ACTN|nr:very short patch repair endonuclease [Nocardioides jejuensis]TCJ21668.1 very short patch repair endonuclease [Nocardioides jejuensis]